jgi:hypothetical protein
MNKYELKIGDVVEVVPQDDPSFKERSSLYNLGSRVPTSLVKLYGSRLNVVEADGENGTVSVDGDLGTHWSMARFRKVAAAHPAPLDDLYLAADALGKLWSFIPMPKDRLLADLNNAREFKALKVFKASEVNLKTESVTKYSF